MSWGTYKDVKKYESTAYKQIPNDTNAIGYIESVKIDVYDNISSINFKYKLSHPEDYNGIAVFLKLKINDPDDKTSARARGLFAAIDNQLWAGYSKLNYEKSLLHELIDGEASGATFDQLITTGVISHAWGNANIPIALKLGLTAPTATGRQYQYILSVLDYSALEPQSAPTVKTPPQRPSAIKPPPMASPPKPPAMVIGHEEANNIPY